MARYKRTLTLGKVLSAVGLLWRLVACVLLVFGVSFMAEGVPFVVGVCILSGGLVVYGIEMHQRQQRFFAFLGAAVVLFSLIQDMFVSVDSQYYTATVVILLGVQLLCPAIILCLSYFRRKRIIGYAAVLLTVLIMISSLGWISFPNPRVSQIMLCAVYGLSAIGMIL